MHKYCVRLHSGFDRSGLQCRKVYVDTSRTVSETVTKELIRNVIELVQFLSWEEVTVREDGLCTDKRSDADDNIKDGE